MRIVVPQQGTPRAEDVAWVVEWQLATVFPWVPIGEESPVCVETAFDPAGGAWSVAISLGSELVRVALPLRDVCVLIDWGYRAETMNQLMRPPARVRASVLTVRRALRKALRSVDPLRQMGYLPQVASDPNAGSRGT